MEDKRILLEKIDQIRYLEELPLCTTKHFVQRMNERFHFDKLEYFLNAVPFYFRGGYFGTVRHKSGKFTREVILGLKYKKIVILWDTNANMKVVDLITGNKSEVYELADKRKSKVRRAYIINPLKTKKWLDETISTPV
jgi:hypothetical protein